METTNMLGLVACLAIFVVLLRAWSGRANWLALLVLLGLGVAHADKPAPVTASAPDHIDPLEWCHLDAAQLRAQLEKARAELAEVRMSAKYQIDEKTEIDPKTLAIKRSVAGQKPSAPTTKTPPPTAAQTVKPPK